VEDQNGGPSKMPDVKVEIDDDADKRLAPRDVALSNARLSFLEALAFEAPEVLHHLRREVLPSFQAIPQSVKEQTSRGPEVITFSETLKSDVVRLPDILLWRNLEVHQDVTEVAQTKKALESWAACYDLGAEWLFDAALQTLASWDGQEDNEDDGDWLFEGKPHFTPLSCHVYSTAPPDAVGYHHPAWRVAETWQDYRKREVERFKTHLEMHKESRRADGFQLPPEVENPEHFVWLALAYGGRKTPEQIIKCYPDQKRRHLRSHVKSMTTVPNRPPEDVNTIDKAIRGKARVIGLPPLKLRSRGRPRKS
jgi:hypothetical protein